MGRWEGVSRRKHCRGGKAQASGVSYGQGLTKRPQKNGKDGREIEESNCRHVLSGKSGRKAGARGRGTPRSPYED